MVAVVLSPLLRSGFRLPQSVRTTLLSTLNIANTIVRPSHSKAASQVYSQSTMASNAPLQTNLQQSTTSCPAKDAPTTELPKLSVADRAVYNRLAEMMEAYVSATIQEPLSPAVLGLTKTTHSITIFDTLGISCTSLASQEVVRMECL